MNRWKRRRLKASSTHNRKTRLQRPAQVGDAPQQSGWVAFLQSASRIQKVVVGVPIALLSLTGTLYGLWGPIWPTNPETAATDVESPNPIAIPIQVKNNSVLFKVRSLKVSCGVESLKNDQGGGLSQMGFTTNVSETLEPASTNLFFCQSPFVFKDTHFVSAVIYLNMTYKHSFMGIEWSGQHEEGPFIWQSTLKPNRWQKGTLIQ